jgi:hypothetical protein
MIYEQERFLKIHLIKEMNRYRGAGMLVNILMFAVTFLALFYKLIIELSVISYVRSLTVELQRIDVVQ